MSPLSRLLSPPPSAATTCEIPVAQLGNRSVPRKRLEAEELAGFPGAHTAVDCIVACVSPANAGHGRGCHSHRAVLVLPSLPALQKPLPANSEPPGRSWGGLLTRAGCHWTSHPRLFHAPLPGSCLCRGGPSGLAPLWVSSGKCCLGFLRSVSSVKALFPSVSLFPVVPSPWSSWESDCKIGHGPPSPADLGPCPWPGWRTGTPVSLWTRAFFPRRRVISAGQPTMWHAAAFQTCSDAPQFPGDRGMRYHPL